MALNQAQQTVVSQADRAAILREYQAISKNWPRHQWLQTRNRYKSDAAKRIKDDATRPPHDSQLRQYIAASSVIHCLDGWSYLGRATDARLKGDGATSCHLAYYAELRATMALLGAEGIGVFDKIHFIVNNRGRCIKVPEKPTTHVFAWEALEHWANTPAAADLVFRVIEPGGIPLGEWLDRFSVGPGSRSILASRWLNQWGIDLKRFSGDREARNVSSYRPTTFSYASVLTPSKAFSRTKDFWRVYEPMQSNKFAILDRYFLKSSLELFFREAHSQRSPKQARAMYKRFVEAMLHQLSPRDTSLDWLEFLTSNVGGSFPLLDDAKGTAEPSSPDHQVQISARAALQLRLATGACHALLASLPLKREDLRFWWTQIGLGRGLWSLGNEPSEATDLWADIRDSVDDIERWCLGNNETDKSYKNLWRENATAASALGTCERIALWGLGI